MKAKQWGGGAVTLNIDEALRYLGVKTPDASLRAQIMSLAEEVTSRITPRSSWVLTEKSRLNLPGEMTQRMLADCRQCAVLACTLGTEFDLWVRREQMRDMARAAMLDALGSAYIEAACDAAEDTIRARLPGMYLTDRFSPGYGDLPLAVQPDLLALAGGSRIGVTLTDALLLNPQKSVTAIVGVADRPQMARIRGCAYCALNQTCPYRKAGTTCHV